MTLYPTHILIKLHSFIFFSSSKIAKWMIPYVCNLSPICGGLFYNHLQLIHWGIAHPSQQEQSHQLTEPAAHMQAWALVPLEMLQKDSFNLSSYKICPYYLAYGVQKIHRGVVTVLGNKGVKKTKKKKSR